MALRIDDVSSLPGRKVMDQEGESVGEIKDVYGVGDDGEPMWVAIDTAAGDRIGGNTEDKIVIVPLGRIREEGENLSVPYSIAHVEDAPEVDADDEISEDDDNKLRAYYSIGLADEEFRTESNSYASQVPEGKAPAQKITDDLDGKETPGGETKDRSVEERHEEYSPSEGNDPSSSEADDRSADSEDDENT
jgi:sporulation protein YlmC with PRC-barrel domain